MTVAEGRKVRDQPASYDDHFSQTRMFWLSLTPVEREHVVRAYTFELGKCYEQAVKERQLLALAQVDADLCAQVAAGLGLAVPTAAEPLPEAAPSPALSQLGATWPVEGRMIGIVVGPGSDAGDVEVLRDAVLADGNVPLLVGPHGGEVAGATVQRTFATARSVEFDALVLTDAPVPGPDVPPSPTGRTPDVDPRVTLLVEEVFRHAKAIAAVGRGPRCSRRPTCRRRCRACSPTWRRAPSGRRSPSCWPRTAPGSASRSPWADPGASPDRPRVV
ncbi:catalase-related domain-containing protein [Nocardioides zeae]